MTRIPVTATMKQRARWLSDQIKHIHGPNDNNYTRLYADDRFYYGYLGELATCEYLSRIGRRIDYTLQIKGGPDDGDFHFHMDHGNVWKADVKTATKHFHRNMMMPQAQAYRHQYDIYIGAQLLSGDHAAVWGWCFLNDFKVNDRGFDASKVPTLYHPLGSLHPMSELVERLQPGSLNATLEYNGEIREFGF